MRILHTILTQGYPAFAELQLEAAKRFWRLDGIGDEVVTHLIHDGPDPSGAHQDIARRYRADYIAFDRQLGHQAINQAIGNAVEFADRMGVDVVVFHGRRWVPLWNVARSVADWFAQGTLVPTLGNSLHYGPDQRVVRNELLALRVKHWENGPARYLQGLKKGPITEDVMVPLTRAAAMASPDPHQSVVEWPEGISGYREIKPKARTLWSFWTRPEEYLAAAEELGLRGWTADDFFVTDRLTGQALANVVQRTGRPPRRRTT